MFSSTDAYAIILAGEEDSRLTSLTRALSSTPVPKQYAFIAGEGSLLQQTVGAYARLLSPKRVVVVVSTRWKELARAQLRRWRGASVLPRQRDGGPALDLLLALEHVMARAPGATVIVAPGNAYAPRASALVAPLLAAEPALATVAAVLAGVPMNGTVLGDRLVIPGPRRTGRVSSVQRMVEHVRPEHLRRFKEMGALWDTSTFISRAATLWQMVAEPLPGDLAVAAALQPAENPTRSPVPSAGGPALTAGPTAALWRGWEGLGVVAAQGSGWSAWTSSEQVVDSLRDPHDLEQLLSRIYQQQQGIDRAQLRRRFRSEAAQPPASRCAVLDNS
jgi:hypothetical protein